MRVKLTNVTIECDVELLSGVLVPTTPIPVVVVPPIVVPDPVVVALPLPVGYDTSQGVARAMLFHAMDDAGLTAVGVQRHGDQIVAALKLAYPALDVYLSRSDAPVWPGFGSIDCTIDSGKGGWAFQVDAVNKPGRVAWQPAGSR